MSLKTIFYGLNKKFKILIINLIIGGVYSRGAQLRSLKLSRSRLTYRALFAIGRGGISLTVIFNILINLIL